MDVQGANRPDSAIDSVFLRDGLEKTLAPPDGLRWAEKQDPLLGETEMEQANHLLLQFRLEVDQQVSANDDV